MKGKLEERVSEWRSGKVGGDRRMGERGVSKECAKEGVNRLRFNPTWVNKRGEWLRKWVSKQESGKGER